MPPDSGQGSRRGFWQRLIPPTPLARRLATQSLLFSVGEGTFNTGSAVFLTKVVGMSAAQAGLGITLTMLVGFLAAYPMGRVVDRLGPKRMWVAAAVGRTAAFAALPFVHSFGAYVAVGAVFGVFEALGDVARESYILDVMNREERLETQAYLYSWLNAGFTIGALLGGAALAVDSLTVIRFTPLFAGALMLCNAVGISRMPQAPHDLRVASGQAREKVPGPSAIRNVGWLITSTFNGTLWTNQVLLNIVIPLWLVERTDAPHVLLAWLFGTNTVLCIFLPTYMAKTVTDVRSARQKIGISTGFFVVSCLITLMTHSTAGLITIALVWLGHVTVTGAELFLSAASWTFQADLMDPRRRGEYQGVGNVCNKLGFVWAPALYTFLAMNWAEAGWLVIAAISVVAAIGVRAGAAMAERYAEQHFPRVVPTLPAATAPTAAAEPA
ncbi:MAG TPA: MFS transporter [Nocardioides sp.]|nr:MFS transporter [Nocardioides sp.]